jgi:hypothetical protein
MNLLHLLNSKIGTFMNVKVESYLWPFLFLFIIILGDSSKMHVINNGYYFWMDFSWNFDELKLEDFASNFLPTFLGSNFLSPYPKFSSYILTNLNQLGICCRLEIRKNQSHSNFPEHIESDKILIIYRTYPLFLHFMPTSHRWKEEAIRLTKSQK